MFSISGTTYNSDNMSLFNKEVIDLNDMYFPIPLHSMKCKAILMHSTNISEHIYEVMV